MHKVLAYLFFEAVVASLLQWYLCERITKEVFQSRRPFSAKSKLRLISLMTVGNLALLFLILGGDTLFGPDFTGRQFLAIAYFSYIRLVLALCLFFLGLQALAYILVPLQPTRAGGERKGRTEGPRMTNSGHVAGVLGTRPSLNPGSLDRGEQASARDITESVIKPRRQKAIVRISRRRFLRSFGAAGVVTGLGTMSYGLSEAYQSPVINEFKVSHQSLDGLREPITIIQVTDFHFGWFWGATELNRLVRILNSIKADAAVFTGDIFHSSRTAIESSEPILRKLMPRRYGNLVIMGNHERYVGADRSLASFRRSNLFHMGNRWVSLEGQGAVVHLGGLDDVLTEWVPTQESRPFAQLIDKSPPGAGMRILLCHRPSILPLAADAAVDLVLAGHTHGGQMIIPWPGSSRGLSAAAFFSPYTHGWYQKSRCKMYLNKGVGLIWAPWRINCPPEIGVFHLVPPTAKATYQQFRER